ncbi:MAG TPA: GTPase HflX [Pseudomonadota bacterium]|nr:GTPase HflX [Pseudomonadota bacterium]
METLFGNLTGLAAADKQLLLRIYRRKVAPEEVVSEELAGFLAQCSTQIKRQVGVLIDRARVCTHVIVGDHQTLLLPDLGRSRAGRGRLRGLRLVHTHLAGEPLSRYDLLDLAKLRLDLVSAIALSRSGRPDRLFVAHLLPPNAQGELWRELPAVPLHRQTLAPSTFLPALENEYQKAMQAAAVVDDGQDRALLVHVIETGSSARTSSPLDKPESRLAELRELCKTAGLRVLDVVTQRRAALDPRTVLGKGKLDEVVLRALQYDATLLVFDPELSPAQARTISAATTLKVIDRTMLILDIFAQHAKSRDGKMQVELAQLRYALPRLVEKDTMMSRLTGGIGGRGPGETKLEINRRRARERIHLLQKQIEALSSERQERRKMRKRRALPVVSIVGYTNAGKSTLLNTLTKSAVLCEDKLFATLDPTSRRMRFPDERELIVTDTVGFISDLPQDLLAAFSATLEELEEADLLLHVLDASNPAMEEQRRSVEKLLAELKLSDKPRLLIYNKIDRLDAEGFGRLPLDREAIALSATQPDTTWLLLSAMDRTLRLSDKRRYWAGWPFSAVAEAAADDATGDAVEAEASAGAAAGTSAAAGIGAADGAGAATVGAEEGCAG